MTEALTAAIDDDIRALTDISDPVERYNAARALRDEFEAASLTIKTVQQHAVNELHDGRPWREVGEMLGVSGSRAEQISRGK